MLKKAEVIRLQQVIIVSIHTKCDVYRFQLLNNKVEHMISEKNILSNLDHPFIVRLSGTFQGDEKFVLF